MTTRFTIGLGLSALFLVTAASCSDDPDPAAPTLPTTTTSAGGDGGSPPSEACANGALDEGESDVDCGGPCAPCDNGARCADRADCASGFCGADDGGVGGGGGQPAGGGGAGGTGIGGAGLGGALVGGAGGLGGSGGADGGGDPAPRDGDRICQACTSSDDCRGGAHTFCDGGTCVAPSKAIGDGCSHDGDCLSGFCPADDGVCCDTACDGACTACLASKTGGQNGTCAAIEADTDPDQECGVSSPETCGAIGMGCNGDAEAPACIVYAEATPCGTPACDNGVQRAAPECDGSGACVTAAEEPCAPYVCNPTGTACATTCVNDSGCESTHYCDAGTCVARKQSGQPCTGANQCTSGFCPAQDGVCCDAACSGTCEACAAAKTGGADGTCAPIPAGDDPDQECILTCNGSGACTAI